ncbi:MAG: molybdopterin guanine dinucleotide synthesis [Cypionkella sp.]|nr:molybdopterin guanine dinucleotide synthesis [Cypionkella sp.]
MRFDRVIILDWSAASAPSPRRPSADAIWLAEADARGENVQYHRTRASAEAQLMGAIRAAHSTGARLLIGCDFPFGYPAGFAAALTGQASARAVWRYFAGEITDSAANANNRFSVASTVNAQFGNGPFWGCPMGAQTAHLCAKKRVDYADLPFGERREVEKRIPSAQPVWKLFTTGSVGSQSLMGLPMIHRLAQMRGVSVWPFDAPLSPIVLAEIYPSLLAREVAAAMAQQGSDAIKDAVQVQLLARALLGQSAASMAQMLAVPNPLAREEGWILGAGFAAELARAL